MADITGTYMHGGLKCSKVEYSVQNSPVCKNSLSTLKCQ